MNTSVGIFLDATILTDDTLPFLNKVEKRPLDSNMLFIIIPEKQLIELEKLKIGKDRIDFINRKEFVIIFSLWTFIDLENKEIHLPSCDPRVVLQFLDTVRLHFEEDFTIVSELKKELLKSGFSSPKPCKENKICIYRKNTSDATPDEKETLREISYITSQKSQKKCNIKLQIDTKTLDFFKHITRAGVTKGDDGRYQREIFGSLAISSNRQGDGDSVIHVLSLDTPSLQFGEKETVKSAIPSLYTFHSHPYQAYIRNNTKLGYPSASDFIATYLMFQMGMIIHFVAALEGLYSICVNLDSPYLQNSQKEIEQMIKKKYKIERSRVKDVKHFLEIANGIGLFHVKLFAWEEASNPFEVHFNKLNNQCVIR